MRSAHLPSYFCGVRPHLTAVFAMLSRGQEYKYMKNTLAKITSVPERAVLLLEHSGVFVLPVLRSVSW